MSNRLRLAVIGVGALGRHHARILSSFPDVTLSGVVDSRQQQGERIAAEFGTQWFSSMAPLMSAVDGVIVAVPTVYHHEVAGPLLDAGIPVLIEKPLAMNLDQSLKLHRL